MNRHNSIEQQIDDATVKRYFDGAGGGGTAATVSMMSHEHNLPPVRPNIDDIKKYELSVIGSTRCVSLVWC